MAKSATETYGKASAHLYLYTCLSRRHLQNAFGSNQYSNYLERTKPESKSAGFGNGSILPVQSTTPARLQQICAMPRWKSTCRCSMICRTRATRDFSRKWYRG